MEMQNTGGVWEYTDPEQARLVFDVWNLTGWEMAGFDQWTNHPTAWKDHPQKLAHLLALRNRLTHAYRQRGADNELLTVYAELLLAESQRIAGIIKGAPLETKAKAAGKKQAARRTGKTTLDVYQKRDILRRWNNAFTTYGLRKSLAREFEVSEDTISRVVKAAN